MSTKIKPLPWMWNFFLEFMKIPSLNYGNLWKNSKNLNSLAPLPSPANLSMSRLKDKRDVLLWFRSLLGTSALKFPYDGNVWELFRSSSSSSLGLPSLTRLITLELMNHLWWPNQISSESDNQISDPFKVNTNEWIYDESPLCGAISPLLILSLRNINDLSPQTSDCRSRFHKYKKKSFRSMTVKDSNFSRGTKDLKHYLIIVAPNEERSSYESTDYITRRIIKRRKMKGMKLEGRRMIIDYPN